MVDSPVSLVSIAKSGPFVGVTEGVLKGLGGRSPRVRVWWGHQLSVGVEANSASASVSGFVICRGNWAGQLSERTCGGWATERRSESALCTQPVGLGVHAPARLPRPGLGRWRKTLHSHPTSCLLGALYDHRWSGLGLCGSRRLSVWSPSSGRAGCGP